MILSTNNFSSYFTSNIFLNDIKCAYLISRSTTIIIKSYFVFIVGSINFENFIIKFIIIFCQNVTGWQSRKVQEGIEQR